MGHRRVLSSPRASDPELYFALHVNWSLKLEWLRLAACSLRPSHSSGISESDLFWPLFTDSEPVPGLQASTAPLTAPALKLSLRLRQQFTNGFPALSQGQASSTLHDPFNPAASCCPNQSYVGDFYTLPSLLPA